MADGDEYYGSGKARSAYENLYKAYENAGWSDANIDRVLRIETPDKLKHIRVTADAIKIEPIITAPIMALPLLLVLLLWLLFSNRKRKSTRGEKHETH